MQVIQSVTPLLTSTRFYPPFRIIENRKTSSSDIAGDKQTADLLVRNPFLLKCIFPTFCSYEEFFTEGVKKTVISSLPTLQSKDLLPIFLHIGAPIELPPEVILRGLEKFQSRGSAHVYGQAKGENELLTSIAHFTEKRYGVSVNPMSEVCVIPGCITGIYIILRDLLRPGLVIIPSPGYPPYYTAAAKGRHDVCAIPLTYENNFMPDIAQVLEFLKYTGNINDLRAIFVNYPHNPTSAVSNLEYLEKVVELAQRYSFLVISDMAYSEVYNPQGEKPHSIFEIPGAKDVAIEIFNLGKTFAMTGDRIGYVIANPTLTKLFETYLKHVHISNVSKPIQFAIAEGIKEEDCIEEVKNRNMDYTNKLSLMANGLRELGWKVDDFQRAGFFLWVRVPDKNSTSREFFNKLLNNTGIAVVPGSDFGDEGEGYIRISVTQPMPILKEALSRLEIFGYSYR